MIQVDNLRKQFGRVTAVDGLTFTVQPGEVVALWGANGAGKTTVLRCLLGLFPYQGRIQINGLDVRKQSKATHHLIGLVPQQLSFHDDMTVQETITFYARLKKVPPGHDFTPLLTRMNLHMQVAKRVGELSGGLQQRLALALALLAEPDILFLDEPTANLDIRARESFLSLLLGLKAQGKTVLFSSHRLEEVMALADRVLMLEAGKLVVDTPPRQLKTQLGWQSTLHLTIPQPQIVGAMALCARHGFPANLNGRGIRVQVAPDQKGQILRLLHEEGVAVDDFTVE